jgi:hypothetical protein
MDWQKILEILAKNLPGILTGLAAIIGIFKLKDFVVWLRFKILKQCYLHDKITGYYVKKIGNRQKICAYCFMKERKVIPLSLVHGVGQGEVMFCDVCLKDPTRAKVEFIKKYQRQGDGLYTYYNSPGHPAFCPNCIQDCKANAINRHSFDDNQLIVKCGVCKFEISTVRHKQSAKK